MTAENALPSQVTQASGLKDPSISVPLNSLEFSRVLPSGDIIKTGLTIDHVRQIAEWEQSVWGEAGRSFSGAVDQIGQELRETSDVWIKIVEDEASLSNSETIHHLRAEIADGLVAGIGGARALFEKDDIQSAAFLQRSILDSATSRKITPDSSVVLYQLKGQRFLDKVAEMETRIVRDMLPAEKNEARMALGSYMKAGFEALWKLGADPSVLVMDIVRMNKVLKYREDVVSSIGMAGAKDKWNIHQLPVVQVEGDIIELYAAA